jgi:hypothetical protein
MDQNEWEPVTEGRLVGFAVGFGLFLLLLFRSEPGFVFFVDHANLLFHEAGHPLIGLVSARSSPTEGQSGN